MFIRKLVKAGQSSFTIALPKDWLNNNKLKKGALLYIIEKSPTELILRPDVVSFPQLKKEVLIGVETKTLSSIKREIISAYLNNAHTIKITGSNLQKHIIEIRSVLNTFIAVEVVEQTSTSIVVQDLLDPKEIDTNKIVKRLDMLVRSIIIETYESLINREMVYNSVLTRDIDVDKLRFLMIRLIHSAMENQNKALELRISAIEALSLHQLVSNLEKISDNIIHICKYSQDMKSIDKKRLVPLMKRINDDYIDVMNSYHSINKDLAEKILLLGENAPLPVTDFIKENNYRFFDIAERLTKVQRFILDIALLTLNKEGVQ